MIKKNTSNAHEFAVYHSLNFAELLPDVGSEMHIEDSSLVHRIQRVLRLQVGDRFILFDRYAHANVMIRDCSKKSVQLYVEKITSNTSYSPEITFLLPVLKKDALEDALYYLIESGVNHIQFLHTDKEQGRWRWSNDSDRLERIAIAAAEQSKNFAFPEIKEPITFAELEGVLPKNAACFYGDPAGKSAHTLLHEKAPDQLVLACGPEGDFTHAEKEQLHAVSFQPLRLTPTILRAETAAFCISSLFRSVFS